ncbi:MAG: N-acetylmuramidase domain-containing protein [Bradyrhizobium sp.]|uniref:N-acetylmuramidase domain-containing protein n=1 Tax=Bradyrhizobium sp. TaxID=376 RepID=UPI003BF27649
MFSQSIVNAIGDAATKAGIEPAALLALVEVETSGSPFEQDGRTPAFLYERHIAWRMAAKVSKALQSTFARAGLAIPKWQKSTQYKDQGTSAKRLALIARARAIDAEVANQSASWGLGQTMGFLYAELGYASACDMVEHLSGNVGAQIECMVRELRNKHLIDALNAHEWARVARSYNGPSYAANRYDVRMADAYKRWQRKLAGGGVATAPEMPAAEVRALQAKLRALGYASVGNPDGRFGTKTVGALSQFQAHEGLPVTGKYDEATRAAMRTAEPIEVPRERAQATATDLKEAGSKTIKAADKGSLFAWAKGLIGTLLAGGGLAEKSGWLESAQDAVDKAHQAKGIWDSFVDLVHPLLAGPTPIVVGVLLIASSVAAYCIFRQVKAYRVADHNSGAHAGPIKSEV